MRDLRESLKEVMLETVSRKEEFSPRPSERL
jgi:hypothetical protein